MNAPRRNLFSILVKVPKEDSCFLYFQLESNEGLCFYSTVGETKGFMTREILINGSLEFHEATCELIKSIQGKISCQILKNEVIEDSIPTAKRSQ